MTSSVVQGISKAAIAAELKQTVPDITRKLQKLGLKPYDQQMLTDLQVAALRQAFDSRQVSGENAPVDFNLPLPQIDERGDRKSVAELMRQWGIKEEKTLLRYAASADAAWRPAKPIKLASDNKFSPIQIALIADARAGVTRYKSHDEYIRRRAAWLDEQLKKEPESLVTEQESDRSEDEGDVAKIFASTTRKLSEDFSMALDEGLKPLVEQARYELSPERLQRRFVGLLVKEVAKEKPAADPDFLSNLFRAVGQVPRRFGVERLAGLLKGE